MACLILARFMGRIHTGMKEILTAIINSAPDWMADKVLDFLAFGAWKLLRVCWTQARKARAKLEDRLEAMERADMRARHAKR